MRQLGPVAFVLIAASICGCSMPWTYEAFDDWWMRPVVGDGTSAETARHYMNEGDTLRQLVGCRSLTVIAAMRRREGDHASARAMAQELMDHFARADTHDRVRKSIVGICLRDAGRGDPAVTQFLKARLLDSADRSCCAAAAWSLASRDMGGEYADVKTAYDAARSAGDSELSYELLGAMWLLGDRTALSDMAQAVDEMKRADAGDAQCVVWWPDEMHRVTREWYRTALESRMNRLSAWSGPP